MSRKKKKKNSVDKEKYLKANQDLVNLKTEISNINRKIRNDEIKAYNLKSEKQRIVEDLAELFLLNSNAKKLLIEYFTTEEKLENIETSNKNRRRDLELKEKKLNDEEVKRINDEYSFKQIGDVPYNIGLYNQVCLNPVAICKQKNVYLSYKDIRNKKCLNKKNKEKPCNHFTWLSPDETFY